MPNDNLVIAALIEKYHQALLQVGAARVINPGGGTLGRYPRVAVDRHSR
jgi:hypothetical protein